MITTAPAPGFDYAAYPQAAVACLVCGQHNPSTATVDRFGLPIGVSQCPCGFAYLNPQLSAEGYAAFYAHAYRPWTDAFRGPVDQRPPADLDARLSAQRGRWIGQGAAKRWPSRAVARLCDLGGGTGAVARVVTQTWPAATVTILDPNPAELSTASAAGYHTVQTLAEDAPPLPPQDVLICAQTLDHLRDPLAVLRWARRQIAPGGWLYVDILHAGRWAAYTQKSTYDWKLDHPCYWTTRSLYTALRATGWRPRLTGAYGRGQAHVAVWCEGV